MGLVHALLAVALVGACGVTVPDDSPGGDGICTSHVVCAMPAIAAGDRHSLVLHPDGTVWAVGDNSAGQLGIGTTTSSPPPVCARPASAVPTAAPPRVTWAEPMRAPGRRPRRITPARARAARRPEPWLRSSRCYCSGSAAVAAVVHRRVHQRRLPADGPLAARTSHYPVP